MANSRRNLGDQKYMIHCCFKHHEFHVKVLRTESNGRPASNCQTHGKALMNTMQRECKFSVKGQYCA